MTNPVELRIEGMTCDHCERSVARALERAGLHEVEADCRRGRARGEAGPGYSEERAAAALEDAGYRLAGTIEQRKQS